MAFSDKLRMLIDEREITQKRLANDLKIPASTLGGYVQGTSEPDFETLKLIAYYFNVTADYLLDIPGKQARNDLENDLLRIFRALDSKQQELYLEQGKAIIKINARDIVKSSALISGARSKGD